MNMNTALTLATLLLLTILLAGFASNIGGFFPDNSSLLVKNECHDARTSCEPFTRQ